MESIDLIDILKTRGLLSSESKVDEVISLQGKQVVDLKSQGNFTKLRKIESDYTKYFILSCVSWYENSIKTQLGRYFQDAIHKEYEHSLNFIRKGILDRGYYSLFDWSAYNSDTGSANINNFLSYFGDTVKKEVSEYIKNNKEMRKAVHDFLLLSEERDNLVHDNLLLASTSYSLNDIIKYHKSAEYFVKNCYLLISLKFKCISNNIQEAETE